METAPENSTGEDPNGPGPTEQSDRQAMPVDHENPPKLGFPVVGIGASAGGIEAFSEFIVGVPADSGMAFVFIQHLAPDRESMMADILSHRTKMHVREVEEGMKIEPNCVYVIRPGHVLTMKEGHFQLGEQLGKRAANRPVDDFFRSLAKEQRERGIGIILSGMGSNGSAGAQAIKAVGGLVIAQDPDSAAYPSMPRHLIDQGYADYILRPEDIPEVLLQYVQHPYAKDGPATSVEQLRRSEAQVREILTILRTRRRQDFNGYKKPTVIRRIQRRMGLTRLTDMGEYARLLRQTPAEVVALADDLLIHVTGFFRDHESWEMLRQQVIVPLVSRREPDSEIRVWVTACSSGEEAYSFAMSLVEEAEKQGKPVGIKVFATDMAERPLQHARAGLYPGGIESEIDAQRLERFFDKEDGLYRIKPIIRECVVFAPQNVLQDPPFSRIDIVSCRNLLIYLEPEIQQRVLMLLHFGLRDGGTLFLGSSETVSGSEGMYELMDKRARIYRRVGPTRHGSVNFPLPHAIVGAAGGTPGGVEAGGSSALLPAPLADVRDRRVGPVGGRPSIALITQRALLERHVQAAVTVDRDHRILYFHGDTRPFLQQPPGEPTRDLMAMARDGLRGSLRVALHRAASEQKVVSVMDGWLETTPGKQARVRITASPIGYDAPPSADCLVISFEQFNETRGGRDGGNGNGNGNGDSADTAGEIRRMQEELQTTIEELQTSNEQLKASNGEISSINEELQSSNEELETSKEEMQSLNEELSTVNSQLQAKMEELQNASNDLSALLHSTTIAVLFLDPKLRIRKYTPATRELMELIPGDVGRPLSDMRRKFEDPELENDVRRVLDRLAPVDREVDAENGRNYTRRVLPYRTSDDHINGVVVIFMDITERRQAEAQAVVAREYAEKIVDTLHEPLLVLNPDLTVRTANPAFYHHFNVAAEATVGRKIYSLGNEQWNIPALRTLLEEVLPNNKFFNDYEVRHKFEELGERVMWVNGRRLNHLQLILLGFRDVTMERKNEADLRRGEERWRRMVKGGGVGLFIFEIASGALVEVNDTFLEMTGYSRADVESRTLTWQALTPPEHAAASEEQMQQYRDAGRIGPYEKEYVKKDGSRAWMLFAGFDLGDGTVVEHCIDIDEMKRASLSLRESEARTNAIANLVPDLLSSARPDGYTTWYNDRWVQYTGRSIEQSLGWGWVDAVHPDDRASTLSASKESLKTGVSFQKEMRIRSHEGAYRWFLLRTEPVRDADGEILAWFGSATDVHEQRMALDELRAGEERFRMLVEGARDFAMVMLDADGRVTAWNIGAQRVLGFTEAEAVGQSGEFIFTPEDRDAGEPAKEMREAIRNGRAIDERWHVRKDGSRFWASGVMHVRRDAAERKVLGFVKVLRDETARKMAADALQSAKNAAEVANRMKDEFMATLSHELRTPLSSILLWSRILQSRGTLPAEQAEALNAILRSAESQKQLIDDLMDTSRITSGKLRLDLRQVELAPIFREAIDSVLPAAGAKEVTLSAAISPEVGLVRIDPDRLRQVVWNLLTNAIKFTPAGGRVEVTLMRRGAEVEIRVADTGRGIDAKFIPHIFEPFRQEESSTNRTFGGLGLGLAICKQLIEQHGGTISAASDGIGKGATFDIRLPLPALKRPTSRKSAAGKTSAAPAASDLLKGVSVLVVEDDADTRTAIATILRAAGAVVTAVESAVAAMESFERRRPDVIVSDIGMSGEDGYSLIRRIRALETAAGETPVPAVALSAFAREQDSQRALIEGFNRHIAKPVDPEKLLSVIADLSAS